jgi:hypothetical protein
MQLHDILSSFRAALLKELLDARGMNTTLGNHIALFTPFAIVLSAEQLLHFTYSCAEADRPEAAGIPEQMEMQKTALSTLQDLFVRSRDFARLICESCTLGKASAISPLVCDCIYQAARHATLYVKETGSDMIREDLLEISAALKMLGSRWMVASRHRLQ